MSETLTDQNLPELIVKKPLAKTPPLGWNSYDCYRNHIGEDETLRNLEAFAEKLAPHGYEYFVVDYGWYSENACIPGSIRPTQVEHFDVALDHNGYPVGSRTYFPGGMKRIADRAHDLGVKFGLHLFRGVIRKAWDFNLPIKGTPYRMRDIADTNDTCDWCSLFYGADMTKPGAQQFYDGLVEHMAAMGVDFIKVDDLVPYPDEMEGIGRAVAKCSRDIVLSMSPGDDTTPARKDHYQWGHMLRITADIWDSRQSIDKSFQRWRDWQGMAGPGFWPDMDMLSIGTLLGTLDPLDDSRSKLTSEDYGRLDLEKVFFRPCNFTEAQERTFITQRALSASPLFMGGCLIRTEQRVLDLITQPDILACNQNGICGSLQSEIGSLEVWRTAKKGTDREGWIGIFNRSATDTTARAYTLIDLGLTEGSYSFRNIWHDDPFAPNEPIKVHADDVVFIEYSATSP